jgi:tRNA (cmo5U34)-methyltransferase
MSDNSTAHSSSSYDEQIVKTIPYYSVFHDETILLVKAIGREPRSWLDTGCGTGTLIKTAVTHFPETQFYLADPSPEMCKIATAKLSGLSSDRITILPACDSIHAGDYLPTKINIVSAIQSHHYLSANGRKMATQACFEILSPEGVYITFENIRPQSNEGIAIGKERWKEFQLSQGKNLDSINTHLARFDSEYFPITINEHIQLLREAGFTTVELFWFSVMQAGFYAIK